MGNKSGFHMPPKAYLKDIRKQRKEELDQMRADKVKMPFDDSSQRRISVDQLSPENVKQYLLNNPNFLQQFASGQISQDRVKAWIKDDSDPTLVKSCKDLQSISSDEARGKRLRFESKAFKAALKERSNKQLDLLVITRNFLKYPYRYRRQELRNLLRNPVPAVIPPEIESHLYAHPEVQVDDICKSFVHMCRQLFGNTGFPTPQLFYFLATLRANYFNVEYHNYNHGLSHAQSMYWILRQNPDMFTELEMKALMIASISHDVGHPGLNEAFLKEVGHGLASIYTSPVLELHHTQTCFLILADMNCNVFCHSSSEDYSKILKEIEFCILSTCVDRYKAQAAHLKQLAEINFNFRGEEERRALKAVLMMVCDLASSWKTWETHKVNVWNLYKEFFKQGDKELKFGFDTGPMMKRPNASEIPKYQVGFLSNLVLPIFRLVAKILPNIEVIVEATEDNIARWKTFSHNP